MRFPKKCQKLFYLCQFLRCKLIVCSIYINSKELNVAKCYIIEKDRDRYFARILELEGCVSQGNTYEEALANIKEAGELYLESLANE